ncbi:MAG: AAA family ATPase [Candidatus Aenigmarchaeota archaeon]|nr:AAA family ATPase [Candidatus Aenigmarchaeota archaeon]
MSTPVRGPRGYYLIIRGPAASGKTAVASRLGKLLDAHVVHFDTVLADHGLDRIVGEGIPAENFIAGDLLLLEDVKRRLLRGRVVIIEACFYRPTHLDHLIRSLPFRHQVFSLRASLDTCIRRNRKRKTSLTPKDVADVYRLAAAFDAGIPIETEGRTVAEVADDIRSRLGEERR